jgi:transcriptional regulator with XRE-family HTH domain
MTNKQKTFGGNLNDLLVKHKKTTGELAKAVGVTPQTIRNYIDGKQEPAVSVLRKIAEFFPVNADFLLGLTECETQSDDYKTICRQLGLTDKAIDTLYKAARFSKLTRDELTQALARHLQKGERKKPIYYNRVTESLNLLLSDHFGDMGSHILCEIADYVTRGADNESLLYANVTKSDCDHTYQIAWDTQAIEIVMLDTLLSGHLLNIQERLKQLRKANMQAKRGDQNE